MQIDLFCSVIDNFGDAGVAWRLACGLGAEKGYAVRLWIDDPACLARLAPGLDPALGRQWCAGIEVHRWQDLTDFVPGDVVIEAFGCRLPQLVLDRMARCHRSPVWINLEYLTTEAWANAYHGLPSPHPVLPLQKYFFFPGFTAQTGGLLREDDLTLRREAFQQDPAARAGFDATLGIAGGGPATRVSLFCYPDSPVLALADAWRAARSPILCLVPEPVAEHYRDQLGLPDAARGTRTRQGSLTVHVVPFLSQEHYDRLLWSCDLNFVRGEDSFVRAQWAARPFVWQAYRQADDAHHDKLTAYLDTYLAEAPTTITPGVREIFCWWNGLPAKPPAWDDVIRMLPEIGQHASRWRDALCRQNSLVHQLAAFIDSKLK